MSFLWAYPYHFPAYTSQWSVGFFSTCSPLFLGFFHLGNFFKTTWTLLWDFFYLLNFQWDFFKASLTLLQDYKFAGRFGWWIPVMWLHMWLNMWPKFERIWEEAKMANNMTKKEDMFEQNSTLLFWIMCGHSFYVSVFQIQTWKWTFWKKVITQLSNNLTLFRSSLQPP